MIAGSDRSHISLSAAVLLFPDASEEVSELAHKIQAPVCDSLMGKGAFSGEDPLYTGMLGMHGTKDFQPTV